MLPLAAPESTVLATLRPAERADGRVWAVAAVHGEAERLARLHRRLEGEIGPGDRLVYLGGYLGYGHAVAATIDELLMFRRAFIARPGVELEDVVFLRGAQEEMWQKLLQLQFAAQPSDVLRWMQERGIGTTIAAYGGSIAEGLAAAEEGVLALTRWTGVLRQAMRAADGHTALVSALRHAAVTADGGMLFVHAGLDPACPLAAQRDHFWWGSPAFDVLDHPYEGFGVVVRGFAPQGAGLVLARPVVTLDAGCGRGGPLVAACFGPDGEVLQVLEA
jgi:serine/threonine protein phosphatase 1